jgi:hypothetical protein
MFYHRFAETAGKRSFSIPKGFGHFAPFEYRKEPRMPHEVVAALIIQSQMILLGQRSATRPFYPAVWDVFGGHVQPEVEKQNAK